jgi:hypothetical protein
LLQCHQAAWIIERLCGVFKKDGGSRLLRKSFKALATRQRLMLLTVLIAEFERELIKAGLAHGKSAAGSHANALGLDA